MIVVALGGRSVLNHPLPARSPRFFPAIISKATASRAPRSRAWLPGALCFSSNQRAQQDSSHLTPAHFGLPAQQRPRPFARFVVSIYFPPFFLTRRHFVSGRAGGRRHNPQGYLHLLFSPLLQPIPSSSPHPSIPSSKAFSSSASNMASSGKIDLNSPSVSWKEAKNYLKGLSSKQRREHYSVKDYIKIKQIPIWKDAAKKLNVKNPDELKYSKNKVLNEKISLFRGDITKLEVDAIINAANSSLLGGGGVDGCIHRAAGPLLKLECSSLNGCETGQAKVTCGYSLPAKCVIHTVGPVVEGQLTGSQEEELRNCYRNSMNVAAEGKLHIVAFPCISTGVYGYPAEAAAEVALDTLRSYLEESKAKFERIIICVFLEKDEEIYLRKLPQYFPLA
ncbi:ADP-ribose glycohydrolase MACROD1 isoform X3 [Ascaphus truei]